MFERNYECDTHFHNQSSDQRGFMGQKKTAHLRLLSNEHFRCFNALAQQMLFESQRLLTFFLTETRSGQRLDAEHNRYSGTSFPKSWSFPL